MIGVKLILNKIIGNKNVIIFISNLLYYYYNKIKKK